MEVYKDAMVYDTGMITVIEIMGRHAGWLAGSAALASHLGAGPDLLYLPEVVFDMDKFLDDVMSIYKAEGKAIIAASEGIHDAEGKFISEYGADGASQKDAFGHSQLGGLAATLAAIVKDKTGAKVRGIELSLLQRCAAHLASQTDIDEAYMAGKVAVEKAVEGETGKMVAFQRDGSKDNYICTPILLPLESVANYEKKVPLEWINSEGNGVTAEFIDYALPLIQGEPDRELEHSLPRFAKLKKILV